MSEAGSLIRPLVFTIFEDGKEIAKEEFTQRSILVGRGDSANLRVADPKVSKIHFVIDITAENEIYLLDLGSTNGTIVNGEKVHRTQLKPGDEITLGRMTVKFAFRELTPEEAQSQHTFVETFEGFFTEEKVAPGETLAEGRERRKVIEVVQIWGDSIIGLEHFMRPDEITIGEGKDCNFFTPADYLPDDPFSIVVNDQRDYYLCFSDMMNGEVELEGETLSLPQLVAAGKAERVEGLTGPYYRYQIHPEAKCRVDIGSLTFFIQRVRPAKPLPLAIIERLDYGYLSVLGLVFFLVVGGAFLAKLLGLMDNLPTADDMLRDQDRFVRLVLTPPEVPKPKARGPKNPDAGEGAKARGEEGKRGSKKGTAKLAKGGVVKANVDRQVAERAGILGVLGASDVNAVFGTGAMNGSLDSHLGGMVGVTDADQIGSGGLGARGTGSGGGGNSLGIGGLGTKGRGTGKSGYGSGGGDFGTGKGSADIDIGGEEVLVIGYDKELIDRVIKRHISQIQACYEAQLRRNPKLYGKVVINFQFRQSGRVESASIKESTFSGRGKPETEQCLVSRFKMFQFPPPKGDGVVVVNYPLLFKSQG